MFHEFKENRKRHDNAGAQERVQPDALHWAVSWIHPGLTTSFIHKERRRLVPVNGKHNFNNKININNMKVKAKCWCFACVRPVSVHLRHW